MKGKVNCTCGWSWNKSDSSAKDMYICHECGRDNSNNIPKAQVGIQTMSSRNKRGVELLLKETENAKQDKHELQTTGQIKNPKSIAYKSKIKKQPELKQENRTDYEKEYDREKGQAKEDKKQFKKNVIAPLDVATDIMQLGNFVPHPIGQTIGKVGNVAGAALDAYQAADDYSEGDYGSAAINAGSLLLPMALGTSEFRRNSKYLRPGQPLYPFSPQANLPAGTVNIPRVQYIEPFTKVKGMTDKNLLTNRALLGTLGAETYMDVPKQKNGGWLDQYADGGTMQEHQENYNDSQASAPEGMIGDGYSNVGRNYSPAWEGQFQMGGSIPGAVGFTYARTKGIQSEGPYAKKTMSIAQNGKEMQYYQNGLDFQPKTISQNGSYITGDKVTYGTPEYREAYNKGEVVTDEGVRSPIALDEVVIQNNYKRPRGFWEQYRDKIVEENKDAGVLGAIIGTPISAITSLPQLMGMKALTGEMERPSEGLGIENWYGAMAIDAIADPSNLIGLGALTKENIIAKLAASKESGLLSNTYKLNPSAFKYNPEAYYRTLGKEGLEDAFNSGVIRPKQYHSKYSPEAGKRINVNTPEFPEGSYFNKSGIYSNNKVYNPEYIAEVVGKDELFTYPKRIVFNENIRVAPKDIPVEDAKFYKKHWLQGYKEVPKQNNAQSSFIKQDLSEGNNIKYSFTDKQGNNIGTFSGKKNPEGIYVNGIEINPDLRRQGLASKIYKDIAKDLQSKNEGTLFSRSTQHQFTDTDELGRRIAPANKLWENLVNKGEAEKFVEGMSHSYRMKPLKKGGIIKDDRGQWAHPGEITEIGSNEITMQGVPYPVLGISDTGDTKLMKPGKNYKFKGKKVTEYPMAKDGLRQEQKGLQNLDNLTNFTNYNKPQPGGWLNKYN